ncbi:MAG: tetratricopeptide repeat protein [Anaerolineae bacterium]|nr:tetratricopeptide repeat protein [Anaerolineae bacterium]
MRGFTLRSIKIKLISGAELLKRWYKHGRAEWYYQIGKIYRHLGNRYGLIEYYEVAVDYFSLALESEPTLAKIYMDRGILYWRELDHPRRAIIDLTEAYTIAPNLIEARFNRGVAHQQLREYDQAIEDFTAYLAIGEHPHWREYAQNMIKELSEWATPSQVTS